MVFNHILNSENYPSDLLVGKHLQENCEELVINYLRKFLFTLFVNIYFSCTNTK